jgi:hypothetical protein
MQDPQTALVDYSVTNADLNQSVPVNIYRSTTTTYNANDPNFASDYTFVGTADIPATAAGGTGTVKVSIPDGLPPDPSHPYVLAVANPSGTVQESDSGADPNDTAFLRVISIGFVVPGFNFKENPDLTWANNIVAGLKSDGYDSEGVLSWNWTLAGGHTGGIVNAGPALVSDALGSASVDLAALPADQQGNAVIDVNLIGHSRGAVVIEEAGQQLQNSPIPQLNVGNLALSMLDPHPANNNYGDPSNLGTNASGLLVRALSHIQANVFNDPNLLISPNVSYVTEYYQQTPAALVGPYLQTPAALATSLVEHALNPWGVAPSDVQSAIQGPDTGFAATPLAPPIGHSEVHDWYNANIVPELTDPYKYSLFGV